VSHSFLVTGGTGFIGAAACRQLLSKGHSVRIFDNNSRGSERRLADVLDDVEIVIGDIRDADAVMAATRGISAVVHLAYVNGTRYFYERPELVLDVGIRGMLNVIASCRANGIGTLIVASSSEVYQTPPAIPTAEDAPLVVPDVLNPRYSYGGGKILTELMAINYGRHDFDRVVVFRPHNVYGPDMGWEHVIPELTMRLLTGASGSTRAPVPFPIQGDGSQTRAFMYVDDCAKAIALLAEAGDHLGIYHVGNPEEVTIANVASRIAAHLGVEIELRPGDAPEGGTSRRCPDITKLRRLGFQPSSSLSAGLPPTVDWYAENRMLQPQDVGSDLA
jgi:dTDP-glucose 4,6-dehydratase/UDP-glucose 4-epimerase